MKVPEYPNITYGTDMNMNDVAVFVTGLAFILKHKHGTDQH